MLRNYRMESSRKNGKENGKAHATRGALNMQLTTHASKDVLVNTLEGHKTGLMQLTTHASKDVLVNTLEGHKTGLMQLTTHASKDVLVNTLEGHKTGLMQLTMHASKDVLVNTLEGHKTGLMQLTMHASKDVPVVYTLEVAKHGLTLSCFKRWVFYVEHASQEKHPPHTCFHLRLPLAVLFPTNRHI